METLQNPVSLPIPASKVPIIDLLSSIPEESPIRKPPLEISLWLDSVEYPRVVRLKMYQYFQGQDQELLWDLIVMTMCIQHSLLEEFKFKELKLFYP